MVFYVDSQQLTLVIIHMQERLPAILCCVVCTGCLILAPTQLSGGQRTANVSLTLPLSTTDLGGWQH